MSFRITGLPAEAFQHLFALSDEELAAHNALRRIAALLSHRIPTEGFPRQRSSCMLLTSMTLPDKRTEV
jgi:hypothetical protein